MSIRRFYSQALLQSKSSGDFNTAPAWTTKQIIKGFMQPVNGGEQFKELKAGEVATHRFYTNLSTSAVYGDRIAVNGVNYTVLFAGQPNGISAVNHHKEILCEVVK